MQAKRYAEDRTIDRPKIHEFAWRLSANKGRPRCSSSRRLGSRRCYAQKLNGSMRGSKFIDGRRLAELLVFTALGVQAEETVTPPPDEDYFESL